MKQDHMSEANHARAELYETMSQLSERLNFAKRFDEKVHEEKIKVRELRRTKPVVFYASVAGIAFAAGAATWFISKKIMKKL